MRSAGYGYEWGGIKGAVYYRAHEAGEAGQIAAIVHCKRQTKALKKMVLRMRVK